MVSHILMNLVPITVALAYAVGFGYLWYKHATKG